MRAALLRGSFLATAAVLCQLGSTSGAAPSAAGQDVLTYHGDVRRTGWNAHETTLRIANVGPVTFGLRAVAALDGRIDAQPLVVTRQPIGSLGPHDVVYVATENDSVYALDAGSGAQLWSHSLGSPVPDSLKDGDDQVYPVIGILSTPVIDRGRGALYVVADTLRGSTDTYVLHALALADGSDLVPPATIGATFKLRNGATWTFAPRYALQRPGLLEVNASIYVAFGSNGDIDPTLSRGLILRFDASTLAPLGGGITNRLAQHDEPYYLSSIWQSGYAPAADDTGSIYLSTGNSNPSRPTYNAAFNHTEGVLKLSGDLNRLESSFTPSNYFELDMDDVDLGSGGTMLLPMQPGKYPHLVVAGGKDGRAFLLDADRLGGYHAGGPDRVLAQVDQGQCWCGPSYFVGSDGVARVVTGGGSGVTAWRLGTGAGKPTLQLESTTGPSPVQGLPDQGGVMPVISSNGTQAGTAIAWYVRRPQSTSDDEPGTPVSLYAYDAMHLTRQLFAGQAGTWRHAVNSNADLVPTVANGRVYVASERQLQIFSLLPGAAGPSGP